MRSPLALILLIAATAACTNDPSTGGGSADGGTFCPLPLNDCAHPNVGFLPSDVDYCRLSAGVAGACEPSSPVAGVTNGAAYTYLDFLNVDVGARLVYDTTGALIAVLYFAVNAQPSQWSCLEGPAFFNATEATSLPLAPSSAQQTLAAMCP